MGWNYGDTAILMAGIALGFGARVLWRMVRAHGRRTGSARPPSEMARLRAEIQAAGSRPESLGWMNCECMADSVTPTVYEPVVVMVRKAHEGRAWVDMEDGYRCQSCRRVWLRQEIEERSARAGGNAA